MSARLLAAAMPLSRIVPVLVLVLLHGLAIGRIGLAGLAVVATIVGHLRGWRPEFARDGAVVIGVVGAVLGGLALLVSSTPPGPLPPVVLSPMCGALTLLACAWSLADRLTPAWAASILLVVVATSSPPVVPLLIPGVAALVVVMLCIFLRMNAAAISTVRVMAFVGYAGLVGLGTVGITRMMTLGEGLLLPLFEAMLDSDAFGSGLGLQSMVPLASFSTASLSDRVIMEVDGAAPAYFRGQVMDTFDGDLWTASEAIQASVTAGEGAPGALSMTLTLFTGLRGNLPAPAGTRTRDGVVPEFTAAGLLVGSALRGDEVVLTRSGTETLQVQAAPDPALRSLPEDLDTALEPLAVEIIGPAQGVADQAAAIQDHLRDHYTYSLTSDLRGEEHPLVVLVRDQKPAYCVYFASAMAAMLRSVDIHTRLVGGFVSHETNPLTGRTMVRKRDAHAWVEVWVPQESRWVAFDPTPSRAAVLNVDEPGVARAVQDFLVRFFLRLRSHPDAVLKQLLLSPPVVVVLLLGVLWSIRLRLRGASGSRRTRLGPATTDADLWPLYQRYLKLLARHKLTPGVAESDDELLHRVAEVLSPEATQAAQAFVNDYRRARYHGDSGADLEDRLAQLKAAL